LIFLVFLVFIGFDLIFWQDGLGIRWLVQGLVSRKLEGFRGDVMVFIVDKLHSEDDVYGNAGDSRCSGIW